MRTLYNERLRIATDCLLASDHQADWQAALKELHTIFSQITAVRGDVSEQHHNMDTYLDGGIAVSPHIAAQCLLDPIRTVQYLRGIQAGIVAAFRRFPGQPIHIVYAGCGPYATLLTPLTTQFTAEEIQLTLIDIHPSSIEGVQRLIQALEIGDYIADCVCADAITYQHQNEMPLHMVVTETMQATLSEEPQIAIMLNFLPQLAENGIFIPEHIVVAACLSDSQQEAIGPNVQRNEFGVPLGRNVDFSAGRMMLGNVLTLNMETAPKLRQRPLTMLEIPEHNPTFDQFLLLTSVTVFDSFGFTSYECELSFPRRVPELQHIANGTHIQFSYEFGRKPGLRHHIIDGQRSIATINGQSISDQ